MKQIFINIIIKISPIFDFIFSPITLLSTLWLLIIRKLGLRRMAISNIIFNEIGLLPIHDHFYQPLINPKKYNLKPLNEERIIGGLDLNIDQQKNILKSFDYEKELKKIPLIKSEANDFFYHNGAFESGDAEYLYNIIRFFKPNKIIEVGSGFSTKMMLNGINQNEIDDKNYSCEVTCIEPFLFEQLSGLPINLVKNKVESLDIKIFSQLNENDILFIDSSHIIRPQGDVLFEIQNILSQLNKGVLIHFHDIFTPRDYPEEWVYKNHNLWNEQYLLESFLAFNNYFEIIGSLNYLKHDHWDLLSSKCPILKSEKNREPGSFWIRKTS
jgi:hypothetical protein